MADSTLYGFYSEQAAVIYGYTVYTTPSGEKVRTPLVTSDVTGGDYRWPDVVARGEVLARPVEEVRTSVQAVRYSPARWA